MLQIYYKSYTNAMNSTDERPSPMGSEAKNTYVENPLNEGKENLPSYEKWKISFQELLEDDEGSKTFYEFLETEQLGVLFECWYSCEQYRNCPPNKATAKEVYSRFVRIKDSRVPISDQARNNLAMRLRANNITENILSEIEQEVFGNLRDICYPKFLKSDFFTFYCETSGQVQYNASDFHKFGKPSSMKRTSNLEVLHEHGHRNEQSNEQQSALTPYEKDFVRTPSSSKICSDTQSFYSDTINDSDKISMADSRTSCGSTGHYPRSVRSCNHDQLPDLANFRPRTQRLNQERLRPLKPDQFAAQLTQKLLKVINDRELEKHQYPDMPHHIESKAVPSQYSSHCNPHETDASEFDTQSWIMPPASDRYSVAGASSHSGSGANMERDRNIKDKAKELRNAVHHSLRNNLGECQCQACFDRIRHEKLYSEHPGGSCYKHDKVTQNNRYHNPQPCCCKSKDSYCNHNIPNTYNHKPNPELHRYYKGHGEEHGRDIDALPVDKSKIFAWMEKNEKYKTQYPEPSPSPALRRKKQPVVYDNSRVQPIAQDLGMPLLPQPDTGNVLEEVKRVLEEPIRGSTKKHHHPRTRPHPVQSSGYYPDQHSTYSDASHEQTGSMASGNWSHSDSTSILSYNPSQISTVPSSASRLWNSQGYYESRSDVRVDYKSEARSHSTGHHGSLHGSSVRSGHRGSNARSDFHSDVRSHSTGRSHGSDNSKSRSKNMTTVTYYFGVEPIPYRISIPTYDVTLGQFKQETKKGNYRFFFKTSDDDGEVVYDEIKDDDELLPRYKDKIIGKVEKLE